MLYSKMIAVYKGTYGLTVSALCENQEALLPSWAYNAPVSGHK